MSLLTSFSTAQDRRHLGTHNRIDNSLPPPTYTTDNLYQEECGVCHIAYPPKLLPRPNWLKLMAELENHFDENAELDRETTQHIIGYLKEHGLQKGQATDVDHWLDNSPNKTITRITELPGFLKDHEEAFRLLGEGSDDVGFMTPCQDCHKEAISGIFDKDKLFRSNRNVFKRFSQ